MSPNVAQRKGLYNVGSIPHAEFNGWLADIGGGDAYPRYLNVYNNLIITESPMTIDQTMMIDEQHNYILQSKVTMTDNLETSNNKIIFVVTRYMSDSYFSSVVIYEYEDFSLATTGEEQTFSFELPLNDEWLPENLKIATIIQTFDDYPDQYRHKIFQAEMNEFTDLLAPITVENLDFGEVEVGSGSTQILTVSNFFESTLTGQIFGVYGFNVPGTFEVPPFSSEDIEVTFEPDNTQQYTGQLIIFTDNATYPSFIVNVSGTGIPSSEYGEVNVSDFQTSLSQNYPNPFNPSTKIKYFINDKNTSLIVYNLKGQIIKEFNDLQTDKESFVIWNGKDNIGQEVPSGMYFYKLSNDNSSVKKMILMK